MNLVCQHMRVMEVNKKRELSELYTRLIFPLQGNGWDDDKWITHCGVTFVTMWDEKHLLKNIRFSMIQEMMGLGPMKYCIVSNAIAELCKQTTSSPPLSSPKEDVFLSSSICPWPAVQPFSMERNW